MYDKIAESIQDRGEIHQSLYFPTRINHVDIPDYKTLNRQLIMDIYEWKKEDEKGVDRSNSLGWHSKLDMHKRPQQSFQQLYQFICDSCVAMIEKYIVAVPFTLNCDTMWANINPKGGFNTSHTHPDSIFSGVYYAQAPEDCGQLVLDDPVVTRQFSNVVSAIEPKDNIDYYKSLRPEDYVKVHYNPIPGRLILFPSYLSHYVEPNLNEKDRISVSFNINVFQR